MLTYKEIVEKAGKENPYPEAFDADVMHLKDEKKASFIQGANWVKSQYEEKLTECQQMIDAKDNQIKELSETVLKLTAEINSYKQSSIDV